MTAPIARTAAIMAFGSLLASAQISELVTTRDGSAVYFSTDLTQGRAYAPGVRGLYQADASGASELSGRTDPLCESWQQPDTDGAGSLFSFTSTGCGRTGAFWGPLGAPFARTELATVRFSSNGEWAAFDQEIIRVKTGERISLDSSSIFVSGGPAAPVGRRVTAGNGTALWVSRVPGTGFVRYLHIGTPGRPPTARNLRFGSAIIDDAGRFVIYSTLAAGAIPNSLRRIDIQTGEDLPLVEAGVDISWQALSDDSRWLMFVTRADFSGRNAARLPQVFLMDLEQGPIRQVSDDPSGIAEATLSGDGRIVWASTLGGRLVQIDVERGETAAPVGGSVWVRDISAAPMGSLMTIGGRGFAEADRAFAPPLPVEWNGVSVRIDGSPVPIATIGPTSIRVPIPWDFTEGEHSVEVLDRTGNAFRGSWTGAARALPHAATFVEPAFHGDWSGPVDGDRPLTPGQVAHFYATGLGLTTALPFLTPAPSDPPAELAVPLACEFITGSGPLLPSISNPCNLSNPRLPGRTLWAGLAPGTIGFYQVSVQLPQWASEANRGVLRCSIQPGLTVESSCMPLSPGR